MTTPMSVYARIAERYGVDSSDDEAVDEFFLTTVGQLPGKERQGILNELLDASALSDERAPIAAKQELPSTLRLLSIDDAPPIESAVGVCLLPSRRTTTTQNPQDDYAPGDHVLILEGPFANSTGVVEEVDVDYQILKVTVDIFGRTTIPVEVGFSEVKKEAGTKTEHSAKRAG
jgi:hypothetical protein